MGDAMAAAIGALATLTEIPDGGHYMMADDPEAFADVVLALTDRLD
jgi:pimeloyl-ACP methyl ester carboxylesterase